MAHEYNELVDEQVVDSQYGPMTIRRYAHSDLNNGAIHYYRIDVNLPQLAPQSAFEGMLDILREVLESAHFTAYMQSGDDNGDRYYFRWQFYNRGLASGMRSDGFTQFGNSSVNQCVEDL